MNPPTLPAFSPPATAARLYLILIRAEHLRADCKIAFRRSAITNLNMYGASTERIVKLQL